MMRSRLRIVCAILLAGFTFGSAVTPSPPILRHLNAGDRLLVEIPTFVDTVISCRLICPNGSEIEFKPDDKSNEKFEKQPDATWSQCRAIINIAEGDSGLWMLRSEDADGRERIQVYEISVNIESTAYTESTAFTESPTTSTESDTEDQTRVEYLDKLFINTKFGSTSEISIPDFPFGSQLRCQLIMPNRTMIDVEKLYYEESTKVISRTANSSCSIAINLVSSDFIVYLGDWMLISKGFKYSDRVEKRLPFTIHIEKFVEAAAHKVTVREGNNFYMAVPYFNHEYSDTCKLLPPYGATTNYTRLNGGCWFKVYNVTISDSGIWEINYGDKIRYRAITHLRVNGAATPPLILLYWNEDKPVEANLVPDAVYCRIRTPEGYVAYDGFGPCLIALPRAIKSQHEGIWKMDVGMPGQVITDNYTVNVVVQDAVKLMVMTSVKGDSPDDIYMKNMYLSCALHSTEPIGFCKFRDPSDRILIAAEAVGESRYSWHGTGTNYTAGVYAHECGIRITKTTLKDFGIWRCAIDTKGGTYYGFLTAKALWIRDPEIAATITTVPTLRADRSTFTSLTEENVTFSCSIQAPIRYCYFRARNGTVYNVAPSAPHDSATYVGAGFEAGECGVRFPSLATSDSGSWSCHVGLFIPLQSEQRARFEVIINDTMVVSQRGPTRDYNWLTIEAQVYNKRHLDYCRFVRIDGLGFTDKSPHIPLNIEHRSDPWRGLCSISIRDPTNLDQHPWVIVARIQGQDTEVARLTDIAFPIPRPPTGEVRFRLPGAWIIVMSIGICMILLASFVGPKRNREWTYARASAIRNSLMRKKVEQNANEATRNTAVAA